jgi:hypothetical protein
MKTKEVNIELTPEQKELVRKLTGKDVDEVTLNPEDLEARVPPRVVVN